MLPNFLFIGPSKTGSTWLYEALLRHPEVYVPSIKDIYFFDKHFDKGIDWYEGFFVGANSKKAIGELSHDYLFSKEACERIRRVIPDVKLITCIRNPYERAFSAYLYFVRNGLTQSDFITACKREFPVILEHSCYAEPLRRYIYTFGREQLLILRFDELQNSPLSFITKIYRFIGVNPEFKPEDILTKKVLPSGNSRSYILSYIVKRIARGMRKVGLINIVGVIKRSSLVQKALYVPYTQENKPVLNQVEKVFLKDYFEPDLDGLEKLLEEDFSQWRAN